MFKWTPDVASGHVILFFTIVFTKIFVIYWLAKIYRICQDILFAARAGAGHSKLANEAAVEAGVKIQIVKAATVEAVQRAKDDLIEAAADVAAAHTPVATKLPAELRVTIAKEIDTVAAAGGR